MHQDLKKFAQKGYSVLMEGRRGGGKTAITEAVFNEVFGEKGKDWFYFSGATMDPWIHLLGIPKIVKHEQFGEVTRAVPAEALMNPGIKAIFIDEINRGPEDLRNGLMELIHTQSVNGVKLPNLQTVWAAMNPADQDEEYQVEPMDPAHLDRFDSVIEVPCVPSLPYFRSKYGEDGEAAVKWWKKLPDKGKDAISPRRLEKLVRGLLDEVNIKLMTPKEVSVAGLEAAIMSGKRKLALESMLRDERVPEDAKRQAIQDQVIKAGSRSPMEFGDLVRVVGEEALMNMLNAMPQKMVSKHAEAVAFCVSQERGAGKVDKESRWQVPAGDGMTASGMRSLVLKKEKEEGLVSNLSAQDEAFIAQLAKCYDDTLDATVNTREEVLALEEFKSALLAHKDILGTATAFQLGLAWALHVKGQKGVSTRNNNLSRRVVTFHFRKVGIHEQHPGLLFRWLVGIAMGNTWIHMMNRQSLISASGGSGAAAMGLKFLGNGDTRNVLSSLPEAVAWESEHGLSLSRMKVAMQVNHAKMPSNIRAFLSTKGEDDDDIAVA